ncbi:hypothetical protein VTJ49DRAFT_6099 [Mycothermus thermophilus]|uniref:Phosphoinositide phospholipase C n=1 Tax=Humicola insolens TaxID=85995 RepID=A0ABR3V1V1_HUMIN
MRIEVLSTLSSGLLAASIGNAVLYLAVVRSPPSRWRMAVKTMSTALLSAFATAQGGPSLLAGALALGSLGDAFLAWDDETSFLYGLASFLAAHILYAALFVTSPHDLPPLQTITGWRAAVAGGLSLLVPAMIALLMPRIGRELRPPVVVYSVAIFVMAMTALMLDSSQVILGAVMFCSSDSILAADRFLVPRNSSFRRWMQYAVWILYYAGQLYIALGVLSTQTLINNYCSIVAMRQSSVLSLLVVFLGVLADDHMASSVSTLEFKNRFVESGIVPEVIAALDPSVSFYASYKAGDDGHDELLVPGSTLTAAEAAMPFEFSVENLNNATNVTIQTRFLIYLLDADAPDRSNPTARNQRHYLAGNYTRSGVNSTVLSSAQVLTVPNGQFRPFTPFIPPNPAPNTGVHRYIYALYIQPARFNSAGFETSGMEANIQNWNQTSTQALLRHPPIMSESAPSKLSSRMARLNPFKSKSKRGDDDEDDQGEAIDIDSVGGGGHSALPADIARHHLRVSDALQAFLSREGALKEGDSEALGKLLETPVAVPPGHVTDRSHPLSEYFISSSHNTYLMAHQLYGASSAAAYETTLKAGARCIEIDAWDNPDDRSEPKVTHGYTLVSNVPFRAVCETVRDAVDREIAEASEHGYVPGPVLISLENHCDREGQLRLVQIMKEVWGDRLVSEPVRRQGHKEQDGGSPVRLEDLGSKIAVIVEYHLPDEVDSSTSDSSSDSEDEREARKEYKAKKKAAPPPIIIPELAELGVYAQSVKPRDSSWYIDGKIKDGPAENHLINVSETGLASHMAEHRAEIARHNARHLMRVYPKGTRISSKNLSPVPFWAIGAQICALNWQTFGASMQLNEAMFAGTSGYVLKPASLRSDVSNRRRRILKLRVAGATDVPYKGDLDDLKPYLTCTLLHAGSNGELVKIKKKTGAYHARKTLAHLLGDKERSPQTDPVWDETLEWEFEDDDLVFLRMLIKSDESFQTNPILAVAAVRLLYVQPGWRFVRMLDLKGRETACSLLVKFDIEDSP